MQYAGLQKQCGIGKCYSRVVLQLSQVCEAVPHLIKQKFLLFSFALSSRIPLLEGKLEHHGFWPYTAQLRAFEHLCAKKGKLDS